MEFWTFSATLRFDLGSNERAVIASRSLSTDDELKPNESNTEFSADGQYLIVEIRAAKSRFLRKAITTLLPSIDLVERTIEGFAIETA